MRMYRALLTVVLVLSLSSILAGCGKTGDLYLPDESREQAGEQNR